MYNYKRFVIAKIRNRPRTEKQKMAKIKEILGQSEGNRAKKRPVSDTAKPENDGGLKGKRPR